MAALSNQDRANEVAAIMREPERCPGAITKVQLRAALDAIDDWWEATGAAAANAAIPQPMRGAMTARQKAALFMHILRRRYEVS